MAISNLHILWTKYSFQTKKRPKTDISRQSSVQLDYTSKRTCIAQISQTIAIFTIHSCVLSI